MHGGDMVNRFNSELGDLYQNITGRLTWLLRVFIMGVVAACSCFLLSWELSLTYFLLLPPAVFFLSRFSAHITTAQKARAKNTGRTMDIAADYLRGLSIAKSFHLNPVIGERFASSDEQTRKAALESEKIGIKLTAVQLTTNILMAAILFAFGVLLIIGGRLTLGGLISFVTISQNVRSALELLDSMFSIVRSMKASSTRVCELLDLESEDKGESFDVDQSKPVVSLSGLRFAYTGQEDVLHGLDLQIGRGQHIGIAGESGCGKSTLVKLLTKFYEAPDGCELFGHPQRRWSPRELREKIALVSQDAFLFDGTIEENVRMGRLDATDEEVSDALERANLTGFVASLPEGIRTPVGQGGALLSGGQRQRITIARAILKKAPLVLLDEATSALDPAGRSELPGVSVPAEKAVPTGGAGIPEALRTQAAGHAAGCRQKGSAG